MKDSVSHLHFELGSSASLIAVRDASNKKIGSVEDCKEWRKDVKGSLDTRSRFSKRGDTHFLQTVVQKNYRHPLHTPFIHRWTRICHCSQAPMIGGGQSLRRRSQAPEEQAAPVILEATLASEFNVVSNKGPDSSHAAGGKTTWTLHQSKPMRLTSCFVLCASKDFSKK